MGDADRLPGLRQRRCRSPKTRRCGAARTARARRSCGAASSTSPSRGAMNIEGMGESLIGQLCEQGPDQELSPTSMRLDAATLEDLERMGKKSAAKVLERDREVEGATTCGGCSTGSASATSASAARRCWPITSDRSTRSRARRSTSCEQVREIGPVLAASVRSWFDEPAQSRADRRVPRRRA